MRRSVHRRAAPLLWLLTAVLVLAACTVPPPPPVPSPQVSTPTERVTVLAFDDPAALTVATSDALYASSPIVVLADTDAPPAAAQTALRLGVPLLITPTGPGDPAGVGAEIDRLGATTLLPFGAEAQAFAAARGGGEAAPPPVTTPSAAPPSAGPPPPSRPGLLVLTADPESPAVVTARAAGARVETVDDPDPRIAPPSDPDAEHVVALGTEFGPADVLAARLEVAASGQLLPGGGQVLFPGRRMVALYGHPGVPVLGVLGEQDVAASVQRARDLAAEYAAVSGELVVPAFELISTVADSGPGPDGDYSAEATVEFLRPWVDAAREAGVYVVLDLQPGRADFLTQARYYEELLVQPHVGLALDPEWRLGPDEVPLQQIGSVGIDEVNGVVDWLADLTRAHALPQKLMMLHQFQLRMIDGRERLDTSHDELAVIVHADGFGTPGDKLATWDALHQDEPAGIHWGWKNFYDEDLPTPTPAETLALEPEAPVFVSYQ